MAIRLTKHLLAGVLVLWSPVVSNVQNRTDSAAAAADYGQACNKTEECSSLGPEFWCHPEHRNCSCKGVLLWFVSLHRCAQAVALKEECEASEQCIAYDRHSYCGEFGRSQLPPKICQCQFGFNMKDLHNQPRCIEKLSTAQCHSGQVQPRSLMSQWCSVFNHMPTWSPSVFEPAMGPLQLSPMPATSIRPVQRLSRTCHRVTRRQ